MNHCIEHIPIDSSEGRNEAIPFRRCEYPLYASPTAGIIGQQNTVQVRMKSVSVREHSAHEERTEGGVVVLDMAGREE